MKRLKQVLGYFFLIESLTTICIFIFTDTFQNGLVVGIMTFFLFTLLSYFCLKKPKSRIRQIESENIRPPDNHLDISANTNTDIPSATQYIETKNTIYCADGKTISNEEIPNLIRVGYENAIQNEKESSNPKFHRTSREEELSFNFEMKYSHQINTLTKKFEILYQNAYKTNDLNERIALLNESISAFERAKKFCYSKGKGGTIYFQDTWEYLHNSHNPCFSYYDCIQNMIKETLYLKDNVIPSIIHVIANNEGILQKNIYKSLPNIHKSIIQRTLKQLESSGTISRTKKGNSYELHML